MGGGRGDRERERKWLTLHLELRQKLRKRNKDEVSCTAGGLLWAESGDVVILVAALALFGLGDAFHAGAGG